MSSVKKIRLSKPVQIFSQTLSEIEMKEPNAGQLIAWGEPRTLVFSSSGSGYFVENADVIGKYLDILIEHEHGGKVLLGILSLEDGLAVKEALFSFFVGAAERLAARQSQASSLTSA